MSRDPKHKAWARARLGTGGLALALFSVSMFLPFVTDVGGNPFSLGDTTDFTYRGLFAFLWKLGIGLGNLFFAAAVILLLVRGKRMSPWGSFALASGLCIVMSAVWLTFDHNDVIVYRLHAGYYLWASAFAVLPVAFLLWPRTTIMAPLTLYLAVLLMVSHELVGELHVVPAARGKVEAAGGDPEALRRIYFELPEDAEVKNDVWYLFATNPGCPADVLDEIGSWAARHGKHRALKVVTRHPNTARGTLQEILDRTELRPGVYAELRETARVRLEGE